MMKVVSPREGMTLDHVWRLCPFKKVVGQQVNWADPFANVGAAYASPDAVPGDPPPDMLADLSATIRAGKSVLVMGVTAAGRDRVVQLLLAAQNTPGGRA